MPFHLVRFALALSALVWPAEPALAETSPSPADDLAAMMAKAEGDDYLLGIMRQLEQVKIQPELADDWIDRRFRQNVPNGRFNGEEPIHYRIIDQVQAAQVRARYYAEIMGADLNNDGSISKQEVKDTLPIRPIQSAAEAFFASDANEDGILSPEEIRNAANHLSEIRDQVHTADEMQLFDFDDDGVLTLDERKRGLRALGLGGN